MEKDNLFYPNFKRICTEKGYTVYRVFKDLNLNKNKSTLWRNGSIPKAETLVKLSKYLDCQVADFFLPIDAEYMDTSKTTIFLDEDEIDIINYYRSLSRQQKHMFLSSLYQQQVDKNGKK